MWEVAIAIKKAIKLDYQFSAILYSLFSDL